MDACGHGALSSSAAAESGIGLVAGDGRCDVFFNGNGMDATQAGNGGGGGNPRPGESCAAPPVSSALVSLRLFFLFFLFTLHPTFFSLCDP
jgi:hypothetical protein